MHRQPATQEYQPRTIHANNRVRLDILPAFPSILVKTEQDHIDLHYTAPLLANISSHLLTSHERQRRLPDAYPNAFEQKPNYSLLAIFNSEDMSFIYALYELFLGKCSRIWNVDMAILDYNLVRLHKCLDKVYRETCLCCHPRDDLTYRQIQPAVQFSTNYIHRFLNKHETILNCVATCDTTDIVYALTCPCGQFDFVSSTTMSFAECFIYHQQEGNRIIRESLIGTTTIDRIFKKSTQSKINDTLSLYQHSTQCPYAIQLFLDCHPEYWCLIPMKFDEANKENSIMTSTTIQLPINRIKKNIDIYTLLNAIPKPPPAYTFSQRQHKQQFHLMIRI